MNENEMAAMGIEGINALRQYEADVAGEQTDLRLGYDGDIDVYTAMLIWPSGSRRPIAGGGNTIGEALRELSARLGSRNCSVAGE